MQLIDSLQEALRHLDSRQLRRRRRVAETACAAHMRIDGRDMLAFASNDYLGLAAHPALAAALAEGAARYGAGSGGSHLLGGHSRAHARLEDELAAFTGAFVDRPRALYFTTGYMANLATLGTLVGKGGTLFCDALNHASLIDGARLARADVQVYPHADLAALETLLAQCTTRERMIVTDSVFSMDGDIAPLAGLLTLAERHGAWLMVDDAHGFGLLGQAGRGAVDAAGLRSPNLVYAGTLGKAAGVAGAFVVGHETLIEWLVQRARPYIFTTASPPAVAHAVSASLALIAGPEGDARRAHLRTLIDLTRDALAALPWKTLDSRTPIQSLIVGGNAAALDLSAALDAQGIWAPAIRPPTVPKHTARLRISLSAGHTRDDIGRLAEALHDIHAAVAP